MSQSACLLAFLKGFLSGEFRYERILEERRRVEKREMDRRFTGDFCGIFPRKIYSSRI